MSLEAASWWVGSLTESFLFLPGSIVLRLGQQTLQAGEAGAGILLRPRLPPPAQGRPGMRTGSRSSPGSGSPALAAPLYVPSGSAGAVFEGITGTVLVSSGKGLALDVRRAAAPASGPRPPACSAPLPAHRPQPAPAPAAAEPPQPARRQQSNNNRLISCLIDALTLFLIPDSLLRCDSYRSKGKHRTFAWD